MLEGCRFVPAGRLPWLAGTFLTMSTAATDLSIIIPSYNEEARLPETLERIAAYLSESGRSAEGWL